MKPRSRARGIALQVLYETDMANNHLPAEVLRTRLEEIPLSEDLAEFIAIAAFVIPLTYVSVVIGELVPKQFALIAPERIAVIMAGPMEMLARITAPIVWTLDKSSATIFRQTAPLTATRCRITPRVRSAWRRIPVGCFPARRCLDTWAR